jgi:hypothetical protein
MKTFARLAATLLCASMLAACGDPAEPRSGAPTLLGSISEVSTAASATAAPSELALPGARANYVVSAGSATSRSSGLVTPIPADVQRLRFADGVLALDIDGAAGAMYRLYQAAFDRVPDAGGFAFWLALHDKGMPLATIAQGFVASAEFGALYGATPTHAELLTRYYQNVLHRAPDPAGHAWWLDKLEQGINTPVTTLVAFSDSAESRALVAMAIQDGIWLPAAGAWTAELVGETADLAAGRVLAVEFVGIGADSATARLDGVPLAGSVVDGQLLVQLPLSARGAVDLAISAGNRTVNLPLRVAPAAEVGDPAAYLQGVHAGLDAQLQQLAATAQGDEAANLKAIRTALQAQSRQLDGADAATLRAAAQMYAANTGTPAMSSSAALTGAACDAAALRYPKVVKATVVAVAATALAIQTGNVYFWIPSLAATAILVRAPQAAIDDIGEHCLSFAALEFGVEETDAVVGAMMGGGARQAGVAYNWRHKEARRFRLQETRRLPDAFGTAFEVQARQLAALLSRLNNITSVVGLDFSGAILKFNQFTHEQKRAANPGDYRMVSIGDGRIEGEAAVSGQALALTFAFRSGQMPQSPVPFAFTLVHRSEGAITAPFDATLSPLALPTVRPIAIAAMPGQQATGKLAGSGAQRYEIVAQPVKGRVALTDAVTGAFTYTMNADANGDDGFTYRAVNDAGASTAATVAVRTDLQSIFEQAVVGNWTVSNLDPNSGSTYTLTVEPGGTGFYTAGEARYRVAWSISKNSRNEYIFRETGFWHPGYDSGFVEGLAYPVTSHYTYHFQYRPPEGQLPDPAQRARFYQKN